jgi:dihydrofolate reductase
MNSLLGFVVSRPLDKAEWNDSRLIRENVTEVASNLKRQSGQDMLRFGSGQLVQTMIQHDLIAQYRLLVFPIVLGKGRRLFAEGTRASPKLVQTEAFDSGVVLLGHRPDRREA